MNRDLYPALASAAPERRVRSPASTCLTESRFFRRAGASRTRADWQAAPAPAPPPPSPSAPPTSGDHIFHFMCDS
ncbi:hypothetical protein B5X24_HaOG210431 [Helicoverpa armigera]|nr:hypothetical protein B5X24_HaOG210431 [Helicoverpa armigera]